MVSHGLYGHNTGEVVLESSGDELSGVVTAQRDDDFSLYWQFPGGRLVTHPVAKLAVERNPRSAATHRVLGDIWRQAGVPERARRAYRRGLRRHPDDRWLRQRLQDVRRELAEN